MIVMLDAALDLARRGFRVFPLAPGKSTPLISKDNGGNGCLDATVDEDQIRQWWTASPAANIGLACGAMADGSTFAVIDLDEHDPNESGTDAWHELRGGDFDTIEVLTPTNGRHIYVRTSTAIANSAGSNFPAGIDVRGEGGYVVAPPSMRPPKGSALGAEWKSYEWEAFSDPTEGAVMADAPDWLAERLARIPPTQKPRTEPGELRGKNTPGNRWMASTSWPDLLRSVGATYLSTETAAEGGIYECWARPGLSGHDLHTSATLYYAGSDSLNVFSTAWPGLPAGPHDKLSFLRHCAFSGDLHRAIEWIKDEETRIAVELGLPPIGGKATEFPDGWIDDDGEGGDPVAPPEPPPLPIMPTEAQRTTGSTATAAGRRTVRMNNRDLEELAVELADAVEAFNEQTPVAFRRNGEYVVVQESESGRPSVRPMTKHDIRVLITQACILIQNTVSKDGEVIVKPGRISLDECEYVMARGLDLPALAGVTETPVLRKDGTFQTRHGWDPLTRVYLWCPRQAFLAIDDMPTIVDVRRAVDLIRDDLLHDFPFDSTADQANAIAMFLTPIVREILTGTTPLNLIDAPEPGSGKSKLCEVAMTVGIGRVGAVKPLPEREEEVRKEITSLYMAGARMAVWDNIEHTVSGASLAVMVTGETWSDRVLGGNRFVEFPNNIMWLATGNNVQIGGDMARRCVRIRLDRHMANPWANVHYRHPEIVEYAAKNRREIIHALCIIVRSWIVAGRPRSNHTFGSFNDWARTIGGILENAGVPDFLANAETMRSEVDVDATQWEGFLLAWSEAFSDVPRTARQIASEINSDQFDRVTTIDPEVVPEWLASKLRAPNFSQLLGKALARRVGRRHGPLGIRVERGPTSPHAKVATFYVTSDVVSERDAPHDSMNGDGEDLPHLDDEIAAMGAEEIFGF